MIDIDLTKARNQEDFVYDRDHRFVIWVGGRGSSKTVSGTVKVMDYVENWPGARGLIIAPNYDMLKAGTMVTFREWFPEHWIAEENRSQDEMWMKTVNGCKIYFRNANRPDKFRSVEPAFVWLDEAAFMPDGILDTIIASMRQTGYPQQLWATSTPKGKNWLWRKFVQPSSRLKNVSVYFSDSRDNPDLDPDTLKSMLDYYKGPWFEQEIEGKFVTHAGLVYPMFSYATHVRPAPPDFVRVFGGIDFGLSSPTSAHLYGVDKNERTHSFREFYQRRAKLADLLGTLMGWQQEFPGVKFYCDPRGPNEIATLRANGAHAVAGKAGQGSREAGTRVVGSRLAPDTTGECGLYFDPACIYQIAEIQSYCHDEKMASVDSEGALQGARVSDKFKTGQDDHAMDDMRYAITGDARSYQPVEIAGIQFGA